VGQREVAADTTLDLPPLAAGVVHLVDVAVPALGRATAPRRRCLPRRASSSSTLSRSNNNVGVMARNVSGAAFDLGTATLSVAAIKRRIP
jgi:hypothetical protein